MRPTPRATDGTNGGPNQRGSSGDLMLPSAVAQLLPTPAARDWRSGESNLMDTNSRPLNEVIVNLPTNGVDWGPFAAAISRWEHVFGRPVPAPRDKKGRLSPMFVEWLMGLDEGWVTGVPELSRNELLKLLGNGVVRQQGAAAVRVLVGRAGLAVPIHSLPSTPERRQPMPVLDLETLTLAHGGHNPTDGQYCLLEAVAAFSGEPWGDHPACVSPLLIDCGISLNDRFPHEKRQALKPLIPLLPGTAGDGLDEARSYLALDWLIRTFTPAWLDLAGLAEEAKSLRDLRRIVDLVAAEAAGPVVRKARERSAAAGDAAWDAAWAAAGDAAWDAAWAAAGDAAGDAAWDAAWAAAGAAAGAAAWDAARDVLKPTTDALQDSAIELFRQMIRPDVPLA